MKLDGAGGSLELEALGRHVAAVQDAQRARLMATDRARLQVDRSLASGTAFAAPRRRMVRARPWSLAAGMAGVAIVGVLAARLAMQPPALTFAVAGARPGSVGELVESTESSGVDLRFSDGTVVQLAPAAAMTVVETNPDGARFALARGQAHVRVQQRPRARWRFTAGPFEVRVTGTRFELDWRPGGEQLTVVLREGSVEVRGGHLPGPTAVNAGHTLVVGADGWRISANAVSPPTSPASSGAPSTPPARDSAPPAAALPPSSAAVPDGRTAVTAREGNRSRDSAPGRWLALAGAGRYDEALARAEEDGLPRVCAQASLPDLLTLAEAARFAKRPDRQREVLLALRRRFPRDPRASIASFMLGRLTFEAGEPAAAAGWFSEYLQAPGTGALAREAAARRMEALDRAGDRAAARSAAEEYLQTYPDGAYSGLARKILAR